MSSPLGVSKLFLLSFFILYVMLVDAAPTTDPLFMRDAGNASTDFQKQNGLDAQKLNAQFASLSTSDPCQAGSMACVNSSFAQCISGKWTLTPCPSGLQCYALPLVKSSGTSLACDTQKDALARIAASGVSGGLTGSFTNGTTTPPSNTSTNDPAIGSDDDGDCTDDPPQSPPMSGNSTHATGGTPHGGSTTTNSTDTGADDCADGDMTSSTKAMATPTPTPSSGGKQLYRRQTSTGSSGRAAVKNGKLFPVTASPFPTASPSANSTSSTISASANNNTTPTQTPVTPLPTATSTNQTTVTTVTLIMVSTVTVTPSGCQTGVTAGLPSGSPTLPSNSPTPTFTLSPSNISSSGVLTTTSSLAVTPSPSPSSNPATSPPAPNVPSTLTPSSNSPTMITNTNTNTGTPLATPSGTNNTPSQGGIAFSTQNNIVAWPTPA